MPSTIQSTRTPTIARDRSGMQLSASEWNDHASDLLADDDLGEGSFDTMSTVVNNCGMSRVPGVGAFSGWTLCGYADEGPRKGYLLRAPTTAGQAVGALVGMVRLDRDGTWAASFDAINNQPGFDAAATGTKVSLPSAESAYRYVVLAHRAHLSSKAH